jgi:ABC-type transporter Mla MlaB component
MSETNFEVEGNRISLPSEVTFYDAAPLCKSVPIIFPHADSVVIDLASVKHADSAAIVVLLSLLREAKKRNKKIVFENTPSELAILINLYRLDNLIGG